jgi:hypothetical protein
VHARFAPVRGAPGPDARTVDAPTVGVPVRADADLADVLF